MGFRKSGIEQNSQANDNSTTGQLWDNLWLDLELKHPEEPSTT